MLLTTVLGAEDYLLGWSCDRAFQAFKSRYERVYAADEEAYYHERFCINYETLLQLLRNGCDYCGLSSIMDRDWSSLVSHARPAPAL